MNVLASVVLIFGSVAMTLGLGAVVASLAPTAEALGDTAWDRTPITKTGGGAPAVWLRESGPDAVEPPVTPMELVAQSAPASLPRTSATGPWRSPLYPQNGVTLWDRIRVSTQRDRRAFLLGIAIQIHAPATAATPAP